MTELNDAALHKRIRSDISKRILSGAWPPGHRIPFEHELMAEYCCSRMTVNKALGPLAEQGLILRRRGAGSFVSRPRIHSVVLDIPDIPTEVTARGEPYAYELQQRKARPAGPRDMAALGLDDPVEVLELRCLHLASGRPFALEERLVNLAAVPRGRGRRFRPDRPRQLAPGSRPVDRGPTPDQRRQRAARDRRPTGPRSPRRMSRA